MSPIARVVTLALSSLVFAAAPASVAFACGSYTDVGTAPAPERADGIWPEVTRGANGTVLRLSYPRFTQSGAHLYQDDFRVVGDARLAALQRAAERGRFRISVTVEQVRPDLWRVVSWRFDRPA